MIELLAKVVVPAVVFTLVVARLIEGEWGPPGTEAAVKEWFSARRRNRGTGTPRANGERGR